MLYHPTILILVAVFSMIISFNYRKIFNLIAITFPVISAILFFNFFISGSIKIFNIEFLYETVHNINLIALAFFCVLFSANLYSISQKRKTEIILGSSYGAFTFLALLANDFISMFVALELMMVISTMLIFIGNFRSSVRSAKKYFLTHLISSNMIMIGIAYIISSENSAIMFSLSDKLDGFSTSSIMIHIMLSS